MSERRRARRPAGCVRLPAALGGRAIRKCPFARHGALSPPGRPPHCRPKRYGGAQRFERIAARRKQRLTSIATQTRFGIRAAASLIDRAVSLALQAAARRTASRSAGTVLTGMTPPAAIREGRIEDAQVLAGFARRMFDEAFGAQNDPGQLAKHLAKSFGREHQARELADAGWTTLLAVRARSFALTAHVGAR